MSRHVKQVRFAPQNTIYPPETSISAIAVSFSVCSSSSRSSVSTESYPLKTDGVPGPSSYLSLRDPRQKRPPLIKYPDQHSCHPLLEMSAITYDLRDPVFTATTTHNTHRLSADALQQSAFIPFLSHITITSSYLPWSIQVYASNATYITLQDILTSIHTFFRTNITPTEFHLLPSHHHRRRATRAYQQRYRRLRHQLCNETGGNSDISQASQSEKRAGMKRVDFLMGYTKLLGISSKGCQPDKEWDLHVTSSTMKV